MARTTRRSRCLVMLAALLALPAGVMAADKGKAPGATLNVQELNRNIAQHQGQRVSVAGEIEEKLDGRSFILESGGLINDEILVLVPKNAQGINAQQLRDDANLVVTGTVRSMPVVEVERELGWDLDPQLEVELEGARNFLVAERISRQQQ